MKYLMINIESIPFDLMNIQTEHLKFNVIIIVMVVLIILNKYCHSKKKYNVMIMLQANISNKVSNYI